MGEKFRPNPREIEYPPSANALIEEKCGAA
jgi:hypothetical protein